MLQAQAVAAASAVPVAQQVAQLEYEQKQAAVQQAYLKQEMRQIQYTGMPTSHAYGAAPVVNSFRARPSAFSGANTIPYAQQASMGFDLSQFLTSIPGTEDNSSASGAGIPQRFGGGVYTHPALLQELAQGFSEHTQVQSSEAFDRNPAQWQKIDGTLVRTKNTARQKKMQEFKKARAEMRKDAKMRKKNEEVNACQIVVNELVDVVVKAEDDVILAAKMKLQIAQEAEREEKRRIKAQQRLMGPRQKLAEKHLLARKELLQHAMMQYLREDLENALAGKPGLKRGELSRAERSGKARRTGDDQQQTQGPGYSGGGYGRSRSRKASTFDDELYLDPLSRESSPEPELEEPALYCVCKSPPDDSRDWVGCEACGEWFHWECVGWTEFNIGSFWCVRCKDCHYFAEDDEMPRSIAKKLGLDPASDNSVPPNPWTKCA